MLARYFLFVNRDYRDSHISLLFFLSQIFGVFISLSVFWYTSKSFGNSLSSQYNLLATSYFEFILLGELCFLIPSAILIAPVNLVKKWVHEATLENMVISNSSLAKEVFLQSFASLPNQLSILLVYFAVAVSIFDWSLNFSQLLWFFALNFIFWPLFYFVGVVSAGVFLTTGRGGNLMGQLTTLLAIASGAYFPTQVLPDFIATFGANISPFQLLLDSTRKSYAGETSEIFNLSFIIIILAWTLLFSLVSKYLLQYAITQMRKRGSYRPPTKSIL